MQKFIFSFHVGYRLSDSFDNLWNLCSAHQSDLDHAYNLNNIYNYKLEESSWGVWSFPSLRKKNVKEKETYGEKN